jgi:hypothetical protein
MGLRIGGFGCLLAGILVLLDSDSGVREFRFFHSWSLNKMKDVCPIVGLVIVRRGETKRRHYTDVWWRRKLQHSIIACGSSIPHEEYEIRRPMVMGDPRKLQICA